MQSLPLFWWFPDPSQAWPPFLCSLICGHPCKMSDSVGRGQNSRTGLSTSCRSHGRFSPSSNNSKIKVLLPTLPIAIALISCMMARFWNLLLFIRPGGDGRTPTGAVSQGRKPAPQMLCWSAVCREDTRFNSIIRQV